MALQEIPLLKLIEHLQALDARLLTSLVKLLRVDAIHADRLEMDHMTLLAPHQILHPLHLCLSCLAIVDTQQLAASVLKILDHHAAELVIWVDHFVVDISYITLSTKVVHCPVEYALRVIAAHVDKQALC